MSAVPAEPWKPVGDQYGRSWSVCRWFPGVDWMEWLRKSNGALRSWDTREEALAFADVLNGMPVVATPGESCPCCGAVVPPAVTR